VKYFFNYNGWSLECTSCTYVLDDHDQEGQFNRKSLLGVNGATDVVGGYISSHDLDNR
jgi:hypothetical protein